MWNVYALDNLNKQLLNKSVALKIDFVSFEIPKHDQDWINLTSHASTFPLDKTSEKQILSNSSLSHFAITGYYPNMRKTNFVLVITKCLIYKHTNKLCMDGFDFPNLCIITNSHLTLLVIF